MVAAASSPPSGQPIREELRAAGLRATSARVACLEVLYAASAPLSHADVFERVRERGFDRATVYRNLVDLARVGLVRRQDLGDHIWRFEVARGGEHEGTDVHPHFACTECGVISCLPAGVVEIHSRPGAPAALGGEIEVHVRGVCDACAE